MKFFGFHKSGGKKQGYVGRSTKMLDHIRLTSEISKHNFWQKFFSLFMKLVPIKRDGGTVMSM